MNPPRSREKARPGVDGTAAPAGCTSLPPSCTPCAWLALLAPNAASAALAALGMPGRAWEVNCLARLSAL